MKKIGMIAIIAIIALSVVACKSTGKSKDSDADLKKTYDRYYGDLILDGAETYTVVSGDTLSEIAAAKYGNLHYYPVIMLASKNVVVDPDKISVGMKLTIPVLKTNLDDNKARGSIKKCLNEIAKIEANRGRTGVAEKMRELSKSL